MSERPHPVANPGMNDDQLLRYSRHILLNELGVTGQQQLLDAHVLVIGAGGLGSAALLYLGSSGVGQLTVVDPDRVDLTNLQRQVAHTQARIGSAKAISIQIALQALNPEVRVSPLVSRADAALLDELVPQADVVLDCCDNFLTRQAVNQACVRHGKPLVSGAAIGLDAQLSVYDPRAPLSPCYACVFPPDSVVEEARCATLGVLAPLVGIVGTMQATEALKLLTHTGHSLQNRLLMLDARDMRWSEIRVSRDPACLVCASHRVRVQAG
jgi:molybdopterin/thiamine biosynthesis adenylyltransferase